MYLSTIAKFKERIPSAIDSVVHSHTNIFDPYTSTSSLDIDYLMNSVTDLLKKNFHDIAPLKKKMSNN